MELWGMKWEKYLRVRFVKLRIQVFCCLEMLQS